MKDMIHQLETAVIKTHEQAVKLGKMGGNTKKWKTRLNEKKILEQIEKLQLNIRQDKGDSNQP